MCIIEDDEDKENVKPEKHGKRGAALKASDAILASNSADEVYNFDGKRTAKQTYKSSSRRSSNKVVYH